MIALYVYSVSFSHLSLLLPFFSSSSPLPAVADAVSAANQAAQTASRLEAAELQISHLQRELVRVSSESQAQIEYQHGLLTTAQVNASLAEEAQRDRELREAAAAVMYGAGSIHGTGGSDSVDGGLNRRAGPAGPFVSPLKSLGAGLAASAAAVRTSVHHHGHHQQQQQQQQYMPSQHYQHRDPHALAQAMATASDGGSGDAALLGSIIGSSMARQGGVSAQYPRNHHGSLHPAVAVPGMDAFLDLLNGPQAASLTGGSLIEDADGGPEGRTNPLGFVPPGLKSAHKPARPAVRPAHYHQQSSVSRSPRNSSSISSSASAAAQDMSERENERQSPQTTEAKGEVQQEDVQDKAKKDAEIKEALLRLGVPFGEAISRKEADQRDDTRDSGDEDEEDGLPRPLDFGEDIPDEEELEQLQQRHESLMRTLCLLRDIQVRDGALDEDGGVGVNHNDQQQEPLSSSDVNTDSISSASSTSASSSASRPSTMGLSSSFGPGRPRSLHTVHQTPTAAGQQGISASMASSSSSTSLATMASTAHVGSAHVGSAPPKAYRRAAPPPPFSTSSSAANGTVHTSVSSSQAGTPAKVANAGKR